MSTIQSRYFMILILFIIFYGAVTRLLPLQSEEAMVQSISEDGYLMMTIARNIALGLGMSTANGTIPTNGTQPLTSFLWAGIYWLVAGDKVQGILGIILIQFTSATLAAVLLWRLGIHLLPPHPTKPQIAILAAALWYASPVTIAQTQNGLETPFYLLAVLGVTLLIILFIRQWSFRHSILIGLLLGITFWIRNDAIFFILAVCLVQLLLGSWQRHEFWQRFLQVNVMGITTVLVALPWLIYNKVNFGGIMPISGSSQNLTSQFGQNLPLLPSVLIEYLLVFFPIPGQLQVMWPVVLASTVVLIGIMIGLWPLWLRLQQPTERRLFLLVSLYGIGLIGFYGLYFGAGHFLGRYLFPLSPFLALLSVAIGWWIWPQIPWQPLRYGILAGFMVSLSSVIAYKSLTDHPHQHAQVIDWVNQHVAEEEWVAAVQTGTLGYFHDRTLNLDGKVNPEALQARRQGPTELIKYVVNKRIGSQRIEYIIDWFGIASWIEKHSLIKQNFKLIVADPKLNLAVLKRQ